MIYTFIIRELPQKKKNQEKYFSFEITGLWHIYQTNFNWYNQITQKIIYYQREKEFKKKKTFLGLLAKIKENNWIKDLI